jgi:hypothetical protein
MYSKFFEQLFTLGLLGKIAFLIVLFFLNFGAFSGADAQQKNFFIKKDDLSWIVRKQLKGDQPDLKDITDGYYYSLLETQTHAELQEEYKHVIKQVISDAGVQNASEITVTYDPTFQKLTFHKIIVWRKNVAIDKLDPSRFKLLQNERDLSKFIYSGTFDAYLLLDDIRKGDRIEYAYTLKGNNPVYGKKISLSVYLEESSNIGQLYNNIIVSPKRNLHYKNFNYSKPPRISSYGDFKLYEWENTRTDIYENLDFEPSWFNPFKRVQITEYNNWNEVVNWGLKVNSYPDLQTPLIVETAKELLIKAKNQPTRFIELASRFVQNEIRYMGVEIGEYSQRPNSPEKVLRQRYGDCKDKSLLLIHLLARAKIKAYMAYVDTNTGQRLSTYLPSPFLFNHAVVVIEYNHKKIWIDPTISDQRGSFDQIYFPDYGQALVLKAGVNQLENIPSKPLGKLKSDLIFTIADTTSLNRPDKTSSTQVKDFTNKELNAKSIADDTNFAADDTNKVGHSGKKTEFSAVKNSALVVKSIYTGNYANNMRSTISEDGINSLQKSYLQYIKHYYSDAELSKDLVVKDDEEANRIEVVESYALPNIWINEDDEKHGKYAYFYGDLILNVLRKVTLKNREEPLTLKYPVNIEQNISVVLPFDLDNEESSEQVNNDFYNFGFQSSQQGNKFNLSYTFTALTDYIDGNQIDTYVKDTKRIKEMLSYYVSYGTASAKEEKADYNAYTILLFSLTILISGYFFYQVYQWRYEYDLEEMANARPIRGWLVLIAINVMLGPLNSLMLAYNAHVFSASNWTFLETLSTTTQKTVWSLITIQCISVGILFAWGILNIVLFSKRRDIFPQQFIRISIAKFGLVMLNWLVSMFINHLTEVELFTTRQCYTAVVSFFITIIWVYYMRKSERVRESFVFSYPPDSWKADLRSHQLEQQTTFKN